LTAHEGPVSVRRAADRSRTRGGGICPQTVINVIGT
jgi:hypothetical protein